MKTWIFALALLMPMFLNAGTDAEYQEALAKAKAVSPGLFNPATRGFQIMQEKAQGYASLAAQGDEYAQVLLARPDRGLSFMMALAQDQLAKELAVVTRTPKASSSRQITIIKTAAGHWQTSTGDTIIQTGAGHWQTSNGGMIIEVAPGHYIHTGN